MVSQDKNTQNTLLGGFLPLWAALLILSKKLNFEKSFVRKMTKFFGFMWLFRVLIGPKTDSNMYLILPKNRFYLKNLTVIYKTTSKNTESIKIGGKILISKCG